MKKVSKFQQFQNVTVAGDFTGLGDLKGIIHEVDFNDIEECFYYLVSCFSGDKFYCNEKFLSL